MIFLAVGPEMPRPENELHLPEEVNAYGTERESPSLAPVIQTVILEGVCVFVCV